MSEHNLQDNLNWLLLRLAFRAKQGLMKISEEYDLSIMQTYTLCLLEPGEEAPMHSISSLLGCDASNVTGIVDRLLTGKYIIRTECERDRRIKIIELTKRGVELRKKLIARITTYNSPRLQNLSAAEQDTLKNLLAKAMADLDCSPKITPTK